MRNTVLVQYCVICFRHLNAGIKTGAVRGTKISISFCSIFCLFSICLSQFCNTGADNRYPTRGWGQIKYSFPSLGNATLTQIAKQAIIVMGGSIELDPATALIEYPP